ncbi:UNVERIFIED_CONTAM: hypothetical protein Scaly_0613100 [Sesamum calycinum]|uniref:Afadin/alpha-actinin-binding protein n=1 Tax=Sesamum calycinum TaxID=2727403 RepID=A0AAW2RTA5_9LAMI
MPPTETDADLRVESINLPFCSLQRSSNNPATLGMSEYAFADLNNLEHCAKYLNNTLVTFGFPASLDLFSNDPQRQRDVEFRESANEQRQRLLSDISRLEAKVERLEAQLSAKDREIATMTRTEAKATAAFKSQIDKLQQERDEFQKMVLGNQVHSSPYLPCHTKLLISLLLILTLRLDNQQVRTQQIHEMKKKEKEYISCRYGVLKEGRQRGTWNAKKTDNDFYKKIVDAYEAKNQELVAENADLRALLRSMQVDMREFLNAPNGKQSSPVNTRVDSDLSQSPLGGRTDMFDLPLHMARDQIEESLRTKMTSIKDRMVQLQDAQKAAELTSEVSERELELEAQLVEARSIIQEQNPDALKCLLTIYDLCVTLLLTSLANSIKHASIMSKHLAKSERPRRLSGHLNSERDSLLSSPSESLRNTVNSHSELYLHLVS